MYHLQETHKYDDIINLPRPVSDRHAHMSMTDRAAQFAPFDALTGYGAAIRETARLTDQRIELSDGAKEELDEKLRKIAEALPDPVQIAVSYFRPDERKGGGAYVTAEGTVRKVDTYSRILVMESGSAIPFGDIHQILLMNEKLTEV